MNELELRQMFKNLSDCYADTWLDIGIEMQQGEVIQAMTEDRFIEALQQAKLLANPAVSKCDEPERRAALPTIYKRQGTTSGYDIDGKEYYILTVGNDC